MINEKVTNKFLSNRDETGRFTVYSIRTGKTYYVEPIITKHTPEWGSNFKVKYLAFNQKNTGQYRGALPNYTGLE